ncbi:ankyrin repeat domain-containing protein [Novosphingobium sp. 1949]|uniref:Ankyrin repeat domain-containing protein n=1 Tax=Novosphingobium organovorum TaxID=2930092 RepID=A0ABT0BFM9_9SPHN|nr:ankyrin repeat domain-containing protein [Novosphingobium organovorum]MCJ2183857.1 ankyrin repeat domain-containing protein [Novosphingobium organovorum]
MSKLAIRNGAALRRLILTGTLAAAAGMMATGAMAQAGFSDGYKFLESVKKKEGDKVEKAIMDSPLIVNTKDVSTGQTALHVVVARRDLTWLRYLVQHGAKVDLADDHGLTPLQMAVNLGWREGAAYLLENHADTEVSNDAGETPLISAVHRRDTELMKALLQAGADPDRSDNSGRSAREYAKEDGDAMLLRTINDNVQAGAGKKSKPVYGPTL